MSNTPDKRTRRHNFPRKLTEDLAKRAGYQCSKPGCANRTARPGLANSSAVEYTGRAAHITAAAPGGPRYDPALTKEQRCSIDNAIHLCAQCADAIDTNGGADYSVELLRDWKRRHEERVRSGEIAVLPASPELRTLVEPAAFFAPYLRAGRLFTHAWELVGRTAQLTALGEFVRSDRHVAVLSGRGGSGKSKVAHALAELCQGDATGPSVRFAAEGTDLGPSSAAELPERACVVVVDDAHRRDDLGTLLAIVQQRPYATKIVLLTRPQGKERLQVLFSRAGIDSTEVLLLPDLEHLSLDEVQELAKQSLGQDLSDYARALANATRDCPLVTVVGGRLLAERQIPIGLLERDHDFRMTVLSRFEDVIIGEVSTRIAPAVCRPLLRVLAAISPYREHFETLAPAIAAFIDTSPASVIEALGHLEKAGVLLRRGRTLRIHPDVLSDHILHQACVNEAGVPTGYAERVFETFESICPAEVLRNLAELDWRIRKTGSDGSALLDRIWQGFAEKFRQAGHQERLGMLQIVEQIAYFLPGRALELVEFVIGHPAGPPDAGAHYPFSHDMVMPALPKILKLIAFETEYLPRCCDLLWRLGRDDDRLTNPTPDHPMRVLCDLAAYDIGKPFGVSRVVLGAVERWVSEGDAHTHVHSALDVLDRILARTGHSHRYRPYVVELTPFTVPEAPTRQLRDQAFDVLVNCAYSKTTRVALRASKSLGHLLYGPEASVPDVSEDVRTAWLPERLRVLGILSELAQTGEPLLILEVVSLLRWHAIHDPAHEIKAAARAVLDSITDTPELRLTRCLAGAFEYEGAQAQILGGEFQEWHAAQQKQQATTMAATVDAFLAQYPAPADGVSALEARLEHMRAAAWPGPGHVIGSDFLSALAQRDPCYAERLVEQAISAPKRPFAPYCCYLLPPIRQSNPGRVLALLQDMVQSDVPALLRLAASHYANTDWPASSTPEDLVFVERLMNSSDLAARGLSVCALHRWGPLDPKEGIRLASQVDVGRDPALAEELLGAFSPSGISIDALADEDLRTLVAKLQEVDDISGCWTTQFLTSAAARDPRAVTQVLLRRIEATAERQGYRALPEAEFARLFPDLTGHPAYEDVLREVRDASLGATGMATYYIPELFRHLSGHYSETSLAVLEEWLNPSDPARVGAVARLISNAPPQFAFDRQEFVIALCEAGYAAGDSCFRAVVGCLMSCAAFGSRSGVPGEPFPEDVQRENRARALVTQLTSWPAQEFYRRLAEDAAAAIERQRVLFEEELE